jgi:hypothetical protein
MNRMLDGGLTGRRQDRQCRFMSIAKRSLTELANELGTDKGTSVGLAHGYTLIYDALFGTWRDQVTSLMEIGLAMGGPEAGFPASRTVDDVPSVQMWHRSFPNAVVHGVDISDCSRFQTEWFRFHQADCGDPERLTEIRRSLSDSGLSFDFIVDDGSHAAYHQQLTLLKFFPLLKPGGRYIIEDLNFSPVHLERSLPKVPTTRDLLGQVLRYGRVEAGGAFSPGEWDKVLTDAGAILTFDDAYLADLRRQFNLRANIPESAANQRHQNSTLRRTIRGLRSTWKAASGDKLSPHFARIKLAVVQKSIAAGHRGSGL